jgi:lambda family phage tail tape measure protein
VAISAQELNIILTAKDKQFAKAMADNQKRVERFAAKSQRDLSKTGKSFSALGTAAKRLAPLLAAAFGARAISNMINAAAEIGNLASVAGLSVERFQEVAFAAQQFGVSAEKMADILKDVNDKFGDFVQTGAGPLADFFENIAPAVGLTADAFAKLSSEEKLGKYIQALEKANLSQADMTFYLEAIASDSTLLQKVFANNGSELDRLSTKIRDAGGVMDKEMVDKARAAKEEFSLASEIINTQFAVALGDLTPLLTDAAYLIGQVASAIGESYQQVRNFFGEINEQDIRARIKSIDDKIAKVKEKRVGKARADSLKRLYSDRTRLEAQLPNLAEDESIVGLPTAPPPPGGGPKPPGSRVKASTAPEREAAEKRLEMLRKGQLATLQAYADAVAEGEDAAAQMAADHVDRLRDVQAAYDSVRGSIDPLYSAYQQTGQAIVAVNDALAEGIITEQQASADRERLIEQLKQTQDELSGTKDLMNSLEQSISTAFGEFITGSASAEDAFKRLASTIIQELIRIEIQNARLGKASLIGSLFSGLGGLLGLGGAGYGASAALGASGAGVMASGGFVPFIGPGMANGGVLDRGKIKPFAKGGVINRPTLFPMAKGAGLMGEAGPEAIMPLTRGPDGKLGVAGGGASVNVNIINQAGAEVDTRQNGPDIDVIIRKAVASDIAGGGQIYRAIGQRFETSTRLTRR